MQEKSFITGIISQKGGIGKSTYTVLLANLFHYRYGKNVSVVDADYPQWSIHLLRERELKVIAATDYYKLKLIAQYKTFEKKMWPVTKCSPAEVKGYFSSSRAPADITFIDLPGSINGEGVLTTVSAMDYAFIPLKADKIVMESALSFAYMLKERIIPNPECNLKGVYLFWTMIDKREKTSLYEQYENAIAELDLPILSTSIPSRTRFNKEISEIPSPVYRSTIFLSDGRFLSETCLEELADEILGLLK